MQLYPKELKTSIQTNTQAQTFTVALFTINKTWKLNVHQLTNG